MIKSLNCIKLGTAMFCILSVGIIIGILTRFCSSEEQLTSIISFVRSDVFETICVFITVVWLAFFCYTVIKNDSYPTKAVLLGMILVSISVCKVIIETGKPPYSKKCECGCQHKNYHDTLQSCSEIKKNVLNQN